MKLKTGHAIVSKRMSSKHYMENEPELKARFPKASEQWGCDLLDTSALDERTYSTLRRLSRLIGSVYSSGSMEIAPEELEYLLFWLWSPKLDFANKLKWLHNLNIRHVIDP
jgi:hypothetical protein